MCITPRVWDIDGIMTEVACNKCWQCRNTRMFDWVGRCIAEAESATVTRCVTLTYGDKAEISAVPNEFAAVSVVKRHVRLWIKRMRTAGYDVRYLIAAEYGPKTGRVHFHCILFFKGAAPKVPLDVRIYADTLIGEDGCVVDRPGGSGAEPRSGPPRGSGVTKGDPFWHHGLTYWQGFTPATAIYVCKYILKSQSVDNRLLRSERTNARDVVSFEWATLSKKPPLGTDYFRSRAAQYVEQCLAPQDLIYTFPDVREHQSGRIRKFHLKRGSASADLFLRNYLDLWAAERGTHPPYSELCDEYLDRMARPLGDMTPRFSKMKAKPPFLPDKGIELLFVEPLNAYACDLEGGGRVFWSFDNDGFPGWNRFVMSPAEAELRRARYVARRNPDADPSPAAERYRAASQSVKRPPLLAAVPESMASLGMRTDDEMAELLSVMQSAVRNAMDT